jgi:hypothetical protein
MNIIHVRYLLLPTTIYILLNAVSMTTAYCMDTGDEICCLCNDSWECGVTSCSTTTETTSLRTSSIKTETESTILISKSTTTRSHSVTITTVSSTTLTPQQLVAKTSVWPVMGYVISGMFGLGAFLWIIHCMYWYVLRCFDRQEQPSCRTELLNLLSTPLARFSDLNVSESTV